MEKEVAILMADLSGYTAMTDVHGGASAARLVTKYMELVHNSLCGQCKIAQRIGDQVVMLSDKAEDLASTALKLNACTLKENHFLSIHAGLHFGPVHQEDGNLFGSTINVASRIMNLAKRGQILCSSAFVDVIGTNLFSFSAMGKVKLKNVLKGIEIFELGDGAESNHPIDPVCHMQINESITRFTYEYAGQTFHFCSQQCRDFFKADPLSFMSFSEL
jgi:class 3 adenylate cyclase